MFAYEIYSVVERKKKLFSPSHLYLLKKSTKFYTQLCLKIILTRELSNPKRQKKKMKTQFRGKRLNVN